jgi:hypothetical protein
VQAGSSRRGQTLIAASPARKVEELDRWYTTMPDSGRAAIEQGLASSNLEDVHDAIVDIGKQGHRELNARVLPYPTSGTAYRKRRAELLAAAKAKAAVSGKEPFDLAKLETMCDTSSHGRLDPVEIRHADFEDRYYVWYPDVMTLLALAEKVNEWNRWM